MLVRYARGVRVGALTIDPTERVSDALWTHRPARRPPSARCLTSAPLARRWPATLGLPVGAGAVAMGFRIELIASGYGLGGVAVLLTRAGERTLVVGPTTNTLQPRRADQLILFAPSLVADPDWQPSPGLSGRLRVPDAAAARLMSQRLDMHGIAHRRPRWLGTGAGQPSARVCIVLNGPGRCVDTRPQADEHWLAEYVRRVAPRALYVHGPRADHLARRLAGEGWPVRVLYRPRQLSLLGDDPEPFVPAVTALRPLGLTDGPEAR